MGYAWRMFRAGAVFVAAIFLIAAVPIPKPNPSIAPENKRPAQSITQHQNATGADKGTAPQDTGHDKPQTSVADQHAGIGKDHAKDWVEIGKAVIETISVAVTATFTVFLALWTNGLRRETRTLVEHGGKQLKKMEESVSESAKAATAMQQVSESLRVTSQASLETIASVKRQSRAYITIASGTFHGQNAA